MKLNLNKKRKVIRKLGDNSFSVVPYVTLYQKDYILEKLLEYYNESKEAKGFAKYVLEFRANLDVMIINATTDIETEGLDYDDLVSSGLIDLIRKTVINYDEIYQDAQFILNVTKMSEIFPSMEDLEKSFSQIPEVLKNMSPEQTERLNMMANAAGGKVVKGEV